MKILIVIDSLHAGGAEAFSLRLARKLNQRGHTCEVLNLNPDVEDQGLLAVYPDLVIHRVKIPFLRQIKRFDGLMLKLGVDFSLQNLLSRKEAQKKWIGHYDLFHTHLIKADWLFSQLKRKHPHIKIISTVHGDYSDYFYKVRDGQKIRWLNFTKKLRTIKESVNRWVVIADEQQSFFAEHLGLSRPNVEKIYNGYEPPALLEYGQNKRRFTIGMVSRGVRLKGWRLLIEAFLLMPDDCLLKLVGKGPYLDALAQEFAGHERIEFKGFHPNPAQEIAGFDVFVLPTLFPYESLPTVVMEALYCGKPVIATDVGEIAKMITNDATGEKAGLLLPFNGNTISTTQLCDYLKALYDSPALAQQYGQAAKGAFEKFRMDACASAYETMYKQILSDVYI